MGRQVRGLGVIVVLACVASGGCKRPQMPMPSREAPEVEVGYPITEDVIKYEVFTGKTESPESVMVRARVTGHLKEIFFKQGTTVQKDQLLFKLDDSLQQADLARAQASLHQAEAHLHRLDYDLERARQLRVGKAMSKEEYDKVVGDRSEAFEAVKVAQANVKYSKQNLDYTEVRAPITGRTGRNSIDRGNLVKADDTVLTTIGAEDPMYVNIDLDERTVLDLQRQVHKKELPEPDKAALDVCVGLADEETIKAPGCPRGYPHKGKIHIVDNKIDLSAGTLRVWCQLDNKDRFLVAGLFARVYIPLSQPKRELLVAEAALGTDQGQKFLYVVNDSGEVAQRSVEIGQLHEGLRVIKSGITPGDHIVINGLQQVRPGAKVRPVIVPMPRHARHGATETGKKPAQSTPNGSVPKEHPNGKHKR